MDKFRIRFGHVACKLDTQHTHTPISTYTMCSADWEINFSVAVATEGVERNKKKVGQKETQRTVDRCPVKKRLKSESNVKR